MKSTILLMRHGRIAQSVPRRFVGQADIPLDEIGIWQAGQVRKALAHTTIGRVVASDLSRAMETAFIVCKGRGLSIEPEQGLREIHLGRWEGLTKDEVRQRYPETFEERGRDMAGVRPQGGENFLDLQDRILPLFQEIMAASSRQHGTTLVVAHGGVNRAILCRLLSMPMDRMFMLGQDYCCVNRIILSEGSVCLSGMNLRPWEEI